MDFLLQVEETLVALLRQLLGQSVANLEFISIYIIINLWTIFDLSLYIKDKYHPIY